MKPDEKQKARRSAKRNPLDKVTIDSVNRSVRGTLNKPMATVDLRHIPPQAAAAEDEEEEKATPAPAATTFFDRLTRPPLDNP